LESEFELVQALKSGNMDAWGIVYEKHSRALYAFISRHLYSKNSADVEDIVQTVFIRGFKVISTFELRSSLRAWLFGIANKVMLEYRSGRAGIIGRSGNILDIDVSLIADKIMDDISKTPEAQILKQDLINALLSAIKDLDITDQNVLRMRYWDGMSGKDMGTETSKSTRAVVNILFKARRKLAEDKRIRAAVQAV